MHCFALQYNILPTSQGFMFLTMFILLNVLGYIVETSGVM